MARFDLNGNPIPDDSGPAASLPSTPVDVGNPGRYQAPPPLPRDPRSIPETYAPPASFQGAPVAPPMPQPYRPAVDPRQAQREYAVKAVAGGSILFLGITIAILFGHPAPVPAPTGYTTYTALNGTFTVDRPDGWSVEQVNHGPGADAAADLAGMADDTDGGGVVFANKSARIAIYQGKIASITGSVSTQLPAQQLLKQQQSDLLNSQFSNVTDDQDYTFATDGFGDGASMTWSSTGTKSPFSSPEHGYYVAMSGGNYYVTVVCQCRETDWPTLERPFQDVVNSLTEMPAPGYSMPVPGGEAYPSGPPQHREPIDTTPGL